jgi:hypothetical protein
MSTLCWSPKGGSGTTVVAASIAVLSARSEATVFIDLGGDGAAALGAATPCGAGVSEWLDSTHASASALWQLSVEVGHQLRLIHCGPSPAVLSDIQAERLAAAIAASGDTVVIDAGPQVGPSPLHRCVTRSLVVVRPCYLALRRAVMLPRLATAAIVIVEPGRPLRAVDAERALGVPVVAELTWDPAVARAVDAGLLSSRLPSSLARQLSRVTSGEPVS